MNFKQGARARKGLWAGSPHHVSSSLLGMQAEQLKMAKGEKSRCYCCCSFRWWIRWGKYTALFPYTAQYEDELSCEAGDTVIVTTKEEEAGWKGEVGRKSGVFSL